MISSNKFRKLALSFPDVVELPHFDKVSFRVKSKIFATLNEQKQLATLKFNVVDQSVFCTYHPNGVQPVPNKWGKQGWTHLNLALSSAKLVSEALSTAYNELVDPGRKNM